jgi:GNAT superfamily N-acetyltransferase
MSGPPSRRWRTIRESLRWRGLLFSTMLAVREVLRPLMYWHAWHIFYTDLARPIQVPYAKEQVSVQIFSGGDEVAVATAQLAPTGQLSVEEIRRRLNQGAVAIACVAGQPAGYMWLTRADGWQLAFGVQWILRANEALRYGSFVLPPWRGLGIHSSMNHALNCWARERGLQRTIGSIGAFNRQSLNLAKHAQNPKVMTLLVVHVRGVNWTYARAIGAPLASRFSRSSSRYVPRGHESHSSQEFQSSRRRPTTE